MTLCLIVFIGGAIGAALRHGINLGSAKLWGTDFPYGIMLINILGSFIMGVLVSYFAVAGNIPKQEQLFLTLGLLGGFTTFSTFSLDVWLLWERQATRLTVLYVAGSVVLAIGGLILGEWAISHLLQK